MSEKDKKIIQALDELEKACREANRPFFATVAFEEAGDTRYEYRVLTPLSTRVPLTNDRITKLNATIGTSFNLVVNTGHTGIPEDIFGDIFSE